MKAAVFSIYLIFFGVAAFSQYSSVSRKNVSDWFHVFDFNAVSFKKPAQQFGPFTRWWWPGNDVTSEELKREINLFVANGFAGVEIQPFASGLNPKGEAERLKKQLSWDTPSFYEHLRVAMEQAKQSQLIVDLNAGSGWPMGGPQITPDSSLLSLAYADTSIEGGKSVSFIIPQLKQEKFTVRPGGFQFNQTVSISYAKLQAVIAARFIKKESNQTFLDLTTVQDITKLVSGNNIAWQTPEGNWKVIAFYSIPDGELPKSIAAEPKGFVVDHLDSNKLFVSYDYLLGWRTGLQSYFGKPLRAVFNDSYEFMPDRHFSLNLLSFFRQQRGYDVAPYLPVNRKKFYNNAYISPFTANQPFDFFYSDEDWRLRYDYNVTISDLLKTEFIRPSNHWLNSRNLLHRTQAYGARMDVIGASGEADIPETEQLAGNNSEAFLKLITSGAHLNNKPIITQESFVFRGFAETTTPQKIRLLADKSFAAGVNQIVYHGTPYKYQTGEFGREGWSPFSSPFSPNDNFSSAINESLPFWNDIKTLNQYISRCQYILQSGKSQADILIYFPFNDFIPEQLTPNPKEMLVGGHFKGIEPEIPSGAPAIPNHSDNTKEWFNALWPLLNKLDASGLTWDFLNDASIQKATAKNGQILINGNSYNGLILANLPYLQLAAAESVQNLAKAGARMLVYGESPVKQPSFLNFEANDEKTKQFIQVALKQVNAKQATNEDELISWVTTLPTNFKFNKHNDFIRTTNRLMTDGSRIKFIWNQSDQWQTISVSSSSEVYKNFYWLNAEAGVIVKNIVNDLQYRLPPYGSIFLYAAKRSLPANMLSSTVSQQNSTDFLKLDNWTIKIGDTVLNNSALFDWKSHYSLKYKSGEGFYSTSFNLKEKAGKKYNLDLGAVYFTANILVNGIPAGKLLWAPYQLDITRFLKGGENKIEVQVTPTYRNEFIGESLKGNLKYAQFKRQEKTLMPAGLVGPVVIRMTNITPPKM